MNHYREMLMNIHTNYVCDSAIAVAARDAVHLLRVRRQFVDALDRFTDRDYDHAMRHFDVLDQIPTMPSYFAWLMIGLLLVTVTLLIGVY